MRMRDFINILLILILTGFAVGITYLQWLDLRTSWSLLYLPLFVFIIMLGVKLNNNY